MYNRIQTLRQIFLRHKSILGRRGTRSLTLALSRARNTFEKYLKKKEVIILMLNRLFVNRLDRIFVVMPRSTIAHETSLLGFRCVASLTRISWPEMSAEQQWKRFGKSVFRRSAEDRGSAEDAIKPLYSSAFTWAMILPSHSGRTSASSVISSWMTCMSKSSHSVLKKYLKV